MLDLIARTEPGPFRPRTIEMGSYYGHFEGTDLVSMAGERLGFDGYTEISAVCTHPDVQGRGFGSALTHHVASEILGAGRAAVPPRGRIEHRGPPGLRKAGVRAATVRRGGSGAGPARLTAVFSGPARASPGLAGGPR